MDFIQNESWKYFHEFSNNGKSVNNDVVLFEHGAPFVLKNNIFNFRIRPGVEFWRFGIRLSKSNDVRYFHPESRYKSPEFEENYIDIHLAAGEWNNKVPFLPNRFQLVEYNLSSSSRVLFRNDNYSPMDEFDWTFEFQSEKGIIKYTCRIGEKQETYSGIIQIPSGFKYFKVAAWADGSDFRLDCMLNILPKTPSGTEKRQIQESKSFTAKNLTVRLGSILDTPLLQNCDITILPVATNGSMRPEFVEFVYQLKIPGPEEGKLGQVRLFAITNQPHKFIGYAFSVMDGESSIQVIQNICLALLKETFDKQLTAENEGGKIYINLPVLGSGTGGVDFHRVIRVFDEIINRLDVTAHIVVSILNEAHFQEIFEHFTGRMSLVKQWFEFPKPKEIMIFEEEMYSTLHHSRYNVDANNYVTMLNLSGMLVGDYDIQRVFPRVKNLRLAGSAISLYHTIGRMEQLEKLDMSTTDLADYDFVSNLKSLRTLKLTDNYINNIDFLYGLKNLRSLNLRNNKIIDISVIRNLDNLTSLNLSGNFINNVTTLESLHLLESLYLNNNQINSIREITNLPKLRRLSLTNNRIEEIDDFFKLRDLKHLQVYGNPFLKINGIILEENTNHWNTINNAILRADEGGDKEIILPAKVLLLGNHQSGKSSLLEYIQTDQPKAASTSTHIIKIEKYPRLTKGMPEAVFFDFGGQDYYHGIYRAFLSSGSIYLILWNEDTNFNNKRKDSSGVQTQDYSIEYWLCQKSFLEKEKNGGKIDPLLLIQTRADKDDRVSFNTKNIAVKVNNEFYINLLEPSPGDARQQIFKSGLEYLKKNLLYLISENQVIRQNQPDWYYNFIMFILDESTRSNHLPKSVKKEILPNYRRNHPDKLKFLEDDLDQLHKQGLILYYKDSMADDVWLNPEALVTYVHDQILLKDIDNTGRLLNNSIDKSNRKIYRLLANQKVIFWYKPDEEYIIPNFLPLSTDWKSGVGLLRFGIGKPAFTLKFECFLPFGIINQIICSFGNYSDNIFWRDQILFDLDQKAKILIQIDFDKLLIKSHIVYNTPVSSIEKVNIVSYIFYGLLCMYWDFELLKYAEYLEFRKGTFRDNLPLGHPLFEQFENAENLFTKPECRPIDMYISLDEKKYIKYVDLCRETSELYLRAKIVNDQSEFTDTDAVLPLFQFQSFIQRKLRHPKKVVISYSKNDLAFVFKLIKHLSGLVDDGLIEEPWYCSELKVGTVWDEEIKTKFEQADVIFFLVSENSMANNYIKEYEIKSTIDRFDKGESVIIVPIILVPVRWRREGHYDLSKFYCLPYMATPVTEHLNENKAWYFVTEVVRVVIDQNLDMVFKSEKLNAEIQKIQLELSKQKV